MMLIGYVCSQLLSFLELCGQDFYLSITFTKIKSEIICQVLSTPKSFQKKRTRNFIPKPSEFELKRLITSRFTVEYGENNFLSEKSESDDTSM